MKSYEKLMKLNQPKFPVGKQPFWCNLRSVNKKKKNKKEHQTEAYEIIWVADFTRWNESTSSQYITVDHLWTRTGSRPANSQPSFVHFSRNNGFFAWRKTWDGIWSMWRHMSQNWYLNCLYVWQG